MQEVCGVHSAAFHRGVYLVSDVFAAAEHEVNFGGHLCGCHAVAAVVALDFDEGIPVDVGGVGVGDVLVLALHGFPAIDFCDTEEVVVVIGDFADAEVRVVVRENCAVYLASRRDIRRAAVILRRGFVRYVRKVESHRVCAEVVGAGVRVGDRADIFRFVAVLRRVEVDRRRVIAAICLHFACAVRAEPSIHKLHDFGVVGSRIGRVESGVARLYLHVGEERASAPDFAGVFDGRHGAALPRVFVGGDERDRDRAVPHACVDKPLEFVRFKEIESRVVRAGNGIAVLSVQRGLDCSVGEVGEIYGVSGAVEGDEIHAVGVRRAVAQMRGGDGNCLFLFDFKSEDRVFRCAVGPGEIGLVLERNGDGVQSRVFENMVQPVFV